MTSENPHIEAFLRVCEQATLASADYEPDAKPIPQGGLCVGRIMNAKNGSGLLDFYMKLRDCRYRMRKGIPHTKPVKALIAYIGRHFIRKEKSCPFS